MHHPRVEFDVVNPWAVVVFKLNATELFQFGIATNDLDSFTTVGAVFIGALPDRHSRRPEIRSRLMFQSGALSTVLRNDDLRPGCSGNQPACALVFVEHLLYALCRRYP